jgi:hypothetical protein
LLVAAPGSGFSVMVTVGVAIFSSFLFTCISKNTFCSWAICKQRHKSPTIFSLFLFFFKRKLNDYLRDFSSFERTRALQSSFFPRLSLLQWLRRQSTVYKKNLFFFSNAMNSGSGIAGHPPLFPWLHSLPNRALAWPFSINVAEKRAGTQCPENNIKRK